ncbi:hypothetical protein BG006_002315, partial [Podila minutissima]
SDHSGHGATNLRSFKIFVVVDGDAVASKSYAVFERLAELECLTALSIRPTSTYFSTLAQGLDLTLASGLGRLATMTRPAKLDFPYTVKNMSSKDVAWMKKHWT